MSSEYSHKKPSLRFYQKPKMLNVNDASKSPKRDMVRKIERLLDEGNTPQEIADKLNIAKSAVAVLIRKYDLK